ncbi:tetratricopeptide repeat protein [Pasteurellaceae bacterium LIM206]|nr:tetratricopeptide repeat protein [Pasteurellaceae bacterium LIM206]
MEHNIATEKMLQYQYQDSEIYHDRNITKHTPPPRTQNEFSTLWKQSLSGDSNSTYLLGRLYFSDSVCNKGVRNTSDKHCIIAFHFFKKAIEQNPYHSLALQWVGACYEFGMGIEQNWKKAIYYYERGAALGNLMSLNNLFVIYAGGLGNIPRDLTKAKYYAKTAAEHGSELYSQYIDNWDSFVETLSKE